MRVGEYGRFQSGFYLRWNQEIFAAVIDHFSIDPRTKAGHLSYGQRAGLHLAMTLAIEPAVLMLVGRFCRLAWRRISKDFQN